jgi:hypothetical protein
VGVATNDRQVSVGALPKHPEVDSLVHLERLVKRWVDNTLLRLYWSIHNR